MLNKSWVYKRLSKLNPLNLFVIEFMNDTLKLRLNLTHLISNQHSLESKQNKSSPTTLKALHRQHNKLMTYPGCLNKRHPITTLDVHSTEVLSTFECIHNNDLMWGHKSSLVKLFFNLSLRLWFKSFGWHNKNMFHQSFIGLLSTLKMHSGLRLS